MGFFYWFIILTTIAFSTIYLLNLIVKNNPTRTKEYIEKRRSNLIEQYEAGKISEERYQRKLKAIEYFLSNLNTY